MKRAAALTVTLLIMIALISGCGFSQFLDNLNSYFDGTTYGDKVEVITEEYYVFSPEFHSCYNSITANQKEIYKKIYSAAESMPTGFIPLCKNYDNAKKDISIAYRAVLYDNPDIFWLPDTYIVGTASKTQDICIAFDHYADDKRVSYPVSKTERDAKRKELNAATEKITAKANELKDAFEKEKYINDFLCDNCEYAENGEFCDTAYGCIVNKKALCEGYAKAFKLLCNKANIECDLIVGKAEGEGHMWNRVNIDGMHSFVDVTWNDRPEHRYIYFNITNEQLEYDHTLSPIYTNMSDNDIYAGTPFNFVERVCSYNGNNYYKKYGYDLGYDFDYDYPPKAAKIITQRAKAGEKYADFWIASEELKAEFENDETQFIAKIQKELTDITIVSYSFERDVLLVYWE